MWQLSIVSSLILGSFCLVACQQADRSNVGNNNNYREDYECVYKYQCAENGTIITQRMNLIGIKFPGYKPPRSKINCTAAGKCRGKRHVCCRDANAVKAVHDISPSPPVGRNLCGRSIEIDILTQITGDSNELQIAEFPWTVLISSIPDKNEGWSDFGIEYHRCIGSLIGQKAVLTAAHCVEGFEVSQLTVRAGKWDGQAATEKYARQDRGVEKVLIHPQFTRPSADNDYAILILDTPVDRTKNVDVLCLGSISDNIDLAHCFVSGYGQKTHGNNDPNQLILKTAQVRLISRETCQENQRTATSDNEFVLHNSYICTDREDREDPCRGDGGAPLVCAIANDRFRYVQVGIATTDFGCGDKGIPDIYANVLSARKWIDDTVAANDLDTSVYRYSP